MRRVVSVFLPHWATDRVRLLERASACDARGHRENACDESGGTESGALVLAGRQGGRRVVASAGAEARALGITPGMAVSQAQAMVPGLRVGAADPRGDAEGLTRLAGWCLRLSPLAAPCPPDGVWIDITGCAHLQGGEAALLARLVSRLSEAGFAARAAVADTPGAAHAAARFGGPGVVAPGGAAALLAPLPVRALRLAPESAEALGRLGFDRIGQLMAAPRGPLTRRFGRDALWRLDQALGREKEPIEPVLPPELCRVRQGFLEPIATAEDLRRVTVLLAEQLCAKLLRREQGACRLDLVFCRVDGTAAIAQVGTAAPSRDAAHLGRLLLAQIETIDPGFGVETAMLSAPLVQSLGARQGLSALVSQEAADLSGLVDMLCTRLGQARVFRLQPVESDIPERSVRAVAAGERVRGDWPADLPRPPRLLHPPRPIEAVALLPDQPPVRFTWRKRAYRVRRADGPERIYGEWWRHDDERHAVRDYFQIEDDTGRRFWIFRSGDGENAETGDLSWYLHGFFG